MAAPKAHATLEALLRTQSVNAAVGSRASRRLWDNIFHRRLDAQTPHQVPRRKVPRFRPKSNGAGLKANHPYPASSTPAIRS